VTAGHADKFNIDGSVTVGRAGDHIAHLLNRGAETAGSEVDVQLCPASVFNATGVDAKPVVERVRLKPVRRVGRMWSAAEAKRSIGGRLVSDSDMNGSCHYGASSV
jgi:hypothetical protein